MNKLLQKIVFFIAIFACTNTLSAQNWPVFSTHFYPSDYIELNRPFDTDAHYNDSVYTYFIKDSIDSNIDLVEFEKSIQTTFQSIDSINLINTLINNKVSKLLLYPKDGMSEENIMQYNILFEGYTLFTKITIKREKMKPSIFVIESDNEEIKEYKKTFRKRSEKKQYKYREQKPDNAGKYTWWSMDPKPKDKQ